MKDDPSRAEGLAAARENGGGDAEDRALRERPTLSIRTRILVSFSLFFILCAAVTAWSIWMAADLKHRIRFLEVAGNFMVEVQQARRFEKNFLLYGTNLEDAMEHLGYADAVLASHGETLSKVMGAERYRTITRYLADYHQNLEELEKIEDPVKRKEVVPRLRRYGARMVSFAQEFMDAEREIVDRHLLLAQNVPFLFLGGLLILLFFVGFVLVRYLLGTLRRFMVYTERISGGDFSPITPVRRYRDEFSKLAEAFNHMIRELEHRQEILVESHKLRAVGTLVAGVAHELNNPLNNTLLSAAALKEDGEEMTEEEKQEILEDVISETERSRRIVRNLLDFARESEARVQPLDLERIVQESVRLVENQVRLSKVKLETGFEEGLPRVHGDEQMLKQVFVNLILNAVDVLPPKGRIRITARKSREEGFLSVAVQDDGPGIPEHLRGRIFEPFFTTKGPGKGTGLGLSVSQGIVHKLGGYIRVESREGGGTTFIVSLPVTDMPSRIMARLEGPSANAPGGKYQP